jgi:hypothetical protein
MSYGDEQVEPGPDESRVLSPGDLVDLKHAADRARMALAELPGAINEGDATVAYSIVGSLSTDLHTIIRNLHLDDIDDDE